MASSDAAPGGSEHAANAASLPTIEAITPITKARAVVNRATAGTSEPKKLKRYGRAAPPPGAGFGFMYYVMRFIGERSKAHFFRRVKVVGGEDFPKDGPVIVCCTHFSTIMDVAIISAYLPHRRPIHYWAKRGLYKRQPFRWILHSSGNIQVDRKTKNNQDLFAGTFEAMKSGEAIGLFPEGGSYTEHRLHSMKAGAAWAALEYAKHLIVEGADNPKKTNVMIVPAAINYTEKSRFRGEAVFQFGKAFSVDEYTEQFLSDLQDIPNTSAPAGFPFDRTTSSGPGRIVPGTPGPHPESSLRLGLDAGTGPVTPADPNGPVLDRANANGLAETRGAATPSGEGPSENARAAVRKLTDRIGAEIYKMTIDAPDWQTWHATKMARELVWENNGQIPLEELVDISNSFIKLLTSDRPEARTARDALHLLQVLVIASSTDVFTLNKVSRRLPAPKVPRVGAALDATAGRAALPPFLSSVRLITFQVARFVSRLPYTIPLMVVYAPAYVVGWGLAYRYASHEEESMASAKALCAFVIAIGTHAILVFLIAALFLFTPPGWLLGLAISYAIERFHLALIDDTYSQLKRLACAWRLLCATLPLPTSLHPVPQVGFGATADEALLVAFDALSHGPPIQWTFKKALIQHNREKKAGGGAAPGYAAELTRPWRAQTMGATFAARVHAVEALRRLCDAVENDEGSSEAVKEEKAAWGYLKGQILSTRAAGRNVWGWAKTNAGWGASAKRALGKGRASNGSAAIKEE